MRTVVSLLILLIGLPLIGSDLEWYIDFPAALKKAQAEDKPILINFSGNESLTPKLQEQLYDAPEFVAFARANLILMEVDLRSFEKQHEEVRAVNTSLAEKFDVESTPIFFILDKTGKRLAKGGYVEDGSAKTYLALIKKIPGPKWRPPITEKHAQPKGITNITDKPDQPLVSLVPIVEYNALLLRGISFGKQKMALINDSNLAEGESALVKVGNKRVKIECQKILESSVVIQVENEANTRELFFKTSRVAEKPTDSD